MTDASIQSPNELVWEKISHVKVAMLGFTDESGRLYSLPLTMVQKEFSGSVWFFVSKASDAMKAIVLHPEVNLAYVDHGKDLYVSLCGHARSDENPQKKEALYNLLVKAWFPRGLADPDLTLLRVDVHSAEYWDVKENKAVQLFKMAKAAATGTRPDGLGEHGTVKID